MKKTLLCLLLVLALLLTACSKQGESSQSGSSSQPSEPEDLNYPVTVRDLTLNERPEKVVSLSPSLTELVYDLGYGDRLVGVSSYCTYPEQAKQNGRDCGTALSPNLDAIRSSGATLVLTTGKLTEADLIALQQSSIDIVTFSNPKKLGELEDLNRDLAILLEGDVDGRARAKELWAAHTSAMEDVSKQLDLYFRAGNEKLEAAYLRVLPYTLATADTLEGQLLASYGFVNSAASYGEWYYPEDKLTVLNPQVIFYSEQIDEKALTAHPNYKTVPAVTDKLYLAIDMDTFECHGGRMFEMLGTMAEFAYPDAFTGTADSPDSDE